jgi:hypothetical protein
MTAVWAFHRSHKYSFSMDTHISHNHGYSMHIFHFVLCGDFNFVSSYSIVETKYNIIFHTGLTPSHSMKIHKRYFGLCMHCTIHRRHTDSCSIDTIEKSWTQLPYEHFTNDASIAITWTCHGWRTHSSVDISQLMPNQRNCINTYKPDVVFVLQLL